MTRSTRLIPIPGSLRKPLRARQIYAHAERDAEATLSISARGGLFDRRFDQIACFALRRRGCDRRRSEPRSSRRGAGAPICRACASSTCLCRSSGRSGAFELILLSEVVYYLSRDDVARLAARVTSSLARGGSVILVHWTGPTNYPLSGDEAAALFIERIGPTCVVERADRYAEFRLDVLSRA